MSRTHSKQIGICFQYKSSIKQAVKLIYYACIGYFSIKALANLLKIPVTQGIMYCLMCNSYDTIGSRSIFTCLIRNSTRESSGRDNLVDGAIMNG